MDANGIAEVAPGAVGVHLSWSGIRPWVYAPGGFTIQRRIALRPVARDCEDLDEPAIVALRLTGERRLSIGSLTVHAGTWLTPLDKPEAVDPTPTDIFRLDLDEDQRLVTATVTAKLSLAVGLREGRVVAVSGPVDVPFAHVLQAARLDAVLIVALDATRLRLCIEFPGDAQDWSQATTLVKNLTLPFRELMPGLADEADELAEARSRLHPGEQIGAEEFGRLAAVLRPLLQRTDPVRPSAYALLLREEPDVEPDEARALDPLRVLLAHPTWRRALGFGWFDDDPALVVGQSYEYRISAEYPDEDVADSDHGFATVASGTLLPTDFSLGGVRLRLPQPTAVALSPDTPADGLIRLTRRGIALDPERPSFWLTPSLDDWSLVADFEVPVTALALDLADGHDLVFATGPATGPFDLVTPVPPGPRPILNFPAADQVRLRGRGFLYGFRIRTADQTPAEVQALTPAVLLTSTPPPAPPLSAGADNLQVPQPAPVDPVPAAEVPARHALGFVVHWRPAPAFGLTGWVPGLEAAPALDATIFQVERRVEPAGDWQPVLAEDDNWTLGDRDTTTVEIALHPGIELMDVFPEVSPAAAGGDLELRLIDAVESEEAGTPQPGDLLRFRVRTIDAIGRASPTATETDKIRLEKHVPPPLPVGPEAEAGELASVGVRVLVRDADDLAPAERTLLGDSDNAIVLRWGWHATHRAQDPFAREFRVYSAPPMDAVDAIVTGVSTNGTGQVTRYDVALQLDRSIRAGVAAGLRLEAGHPFLIVGHTGGQNIVMAVETRLRVAGAPPVPALGPVHLNLPLTPDRSRPPAWGSRVAIVPLTDATAYEVVLRDRLTLTADHPVDQLWLGVSSADDQSYVPDQLAPTELRPGNESAIVALQASGRYAGRPVLEIPPPLAPVPRLRTPEPGPEPLHFPLDLTSFLPPLAFPRLRPERLAAGALLGACRTTADDQILAQPVEPLNPGDAPLEIAVPNPDDRAELAAGLRAGRSTDVADRFLVYLAGQHAYRDRLFRPCGDAPVPPGSFAETLPASPDRWLYRVRGVDAAGHVSAGSATATVVVRVPVLLPAAPPTRRGAAAGDPPEQLRIGVPDDPSVSHLLVFAAPSQGTGPVGDSTLIRVPNRPDLLPEGGLFLRTPDGTLLSPTATAVTPGEEQTVTVPEVPESPGRTRIWLATLTVDGIPSALAGPYTIFLPVGV